MDISVVILSCNRKDQLCYTLPSFVSQTFPRERFEVIVVDDGSTDGTASYLASQTWPFRLKIVQTKKKRGISHARNVGINSSAGKIVVFSDSDMIVPPRFLEEHWQAHMKHDRSVVCAPYRRHIYTQIAQSQFKTKLWSKMVKKAPELRFKMTDTLTDNQKIAVFSPDDVQNGTIETISPPKGNKTMDLFIRKYGLDLQHCPMPWLAFAGSNSSVPRSSLIELGGFDEQFRSHHDDREIGYRLALSGHRFHFNLDIVAIHQDHFLESDRLVSRKRSMHDLALLIKKHPYRDVFLFAMYQADKSRFKPPHLAEVKSQMSSMKSNGRFNKAIVSVTDSMLRYYVWKSISNNPEILPILNDLGIRKPHSFYIKWLMQNKKQIEHAYPELYRMLDYLLKRTKPSQNTWVGRFLSFQPSDSEQADFI